VVSGRERTLLDEMLTAVRQRKAVDPYVAPSLSAEQATGSLRPIADASGVEIRWFGVNESRSDAEIISEDGREWRVVFMTDNAWRLTELWVSERPVPFPGVEGGRAIVVDGAVGAGKSTLMERFADTQDAPWVIFDEVNFGRIRTNHLIWLEACGPLYRGFLAGIAALAAEGNQVIMPSAGLPQAMFLEALAAVPTLYVGLECPLEVLLERNRGREGRWGGLAEKSFADFKANGWRYDLSLNSNALNPDALVAEVRTALRSIASFVVVPVGQPGVPIEQSRRAVRHSASASATHAGRQ
jgi:chloramphenicol 3-O phosphotransferase